MALEDRSFHFNSAYWLCLEVSFLHYSPGCCLSVHEVDGSGREELEIASSFSYSPLNYECNVKENHIQKKKVFNHSEVRDRYSRTSHKRKPIRV